MENQTRLNDIKNAKRVLPGDQLATIEEFSSGSGTTTSGENVVSTIVGEAHSDMKNRVINVQLSKGSFESLPKAGDEVTGTVQSSQPSMAQVMIEAVNDVPSNKELTGMLSFRDERRRRNTSPIKAGDVIRAHVVSTKNAIIHLAIDSPNCGALFTVCSICGNDVVAISRDRVKCRECGWVDERMLADDFVTYSRSQ